MSSHGSSTPTSADLERAGLRLLSAIDRACDPAATFPAQVEAALVTTLGRVTHDRDLATLLSLEPQPIAALRAVRAEWTQIFAALLRSAAERSPQLILPEPFLEHHLIEGIAERLQRALERRPTVELGLQLPSLLEFVLVYYLEPGQVGPHVACALARTHDSGSRRKP